VSHPRSTQGWLLWSLFAEARVILRMYVDPRYYMSWVGRVVPLACLALYLFAWLWVPGAGLGLPFLSYYLDKILSLVVCFVLFKVLAREARRYRETSPDLPPSLRL
jgi:hypothetical protein